MAIKLLVLDLDETLIFGTTKSLDRKPDFDIGEYVIYKRPHLDTFLEFCLKHFDIAVWTSATKSYAQAIVAQLFSDNHPLKFVWSRDKCIQRYNPQQHKNDYIKDLRKVKKQGFQLEHIIAIDDSSEKHVKNYGNLVQVSPFEGEQEAGRA